MNYFELLAKLDDLYDTLSDKQMTAQAIVGRINRAIPFKECKVKPQILITVSRELQVSGLYDPEVDEEGGVPILIDITFPRRRELFEFSPKDLDRQQWRNLCVDIVSTLGHEFVHLHQSRRREFREGRYYTSDSKNVILRDSQEYLGIPDEVEAYAWTAAASMALYLPQPAKFEETPIYQIYSNVFDKRSQVVVKLRKLSLRFYKRLERQFYATVRTH